MNLRPDGCGPPRESEPAIPGSTVCNVCPEREHRSHCCCGRDPAECPPVRAGNWRRESGGGSDGVEKFNPPLEESNNEVGGPQQGKEQEDPEKVPEISLPSAPC